MLVESVRRQGNLKGMWAFGNERQHCRVKEAITNHQCSEMQQRMNHLAKRWEYALQESNVNYDVGHVQYVCFLVSLKSHLFQTKGQGTPFQQAFPNSRSATQRVLQVAELQLQCCKLACFHFSNGVRVLFPRPQTQQKRLRTVGCTVCSFSCSPVTS